MEIINETFSDVVNNIIKKIMDECNGIDCCPNGEDSGWSSCPESDMTS